MTVILMRREEGLEWHVLNNKKINIEREWVDEVVLSIRILIHCWYLRYVHPDDSLFNYLSVFDVFCRL
jgi:hypothetical protein